MMTMARRIHPQQMEAWISKLQLNMRKFLDNKELSDEQRLIFVRQQYILLEVINKVLEGKIYFMGCSHSSINK